MIHDLKCWPEPFAAIIAGEKRHEIRRDDRGFKVGDVLLLREWRPICHQGIDPMLCHVCAKWPRGEYTGRETMVRVTCKSDGGTWGLPVDLCVLSIAPLTPEEAGRLACSEHHGGEPAQDAALEQWRLCLCPATSEYDPPCPRHGVLGIGQVGRS